jgi:uncharacterized protein (DUF2249 family)
MSDNIIELDLREVPVVDRHPMIFESWEAIAPEQTLQIINDHDPKPLHYQFEGEYRDSYEWEYVVKGPEEWRVNITKLKQAEASGEELRKKVVMAIEEVRPYLQADGGDVELVDIDEVSKMVTVKLQGACGGCPSAAMTLKSGVEATIKRYAPEIKGVQEG